MVNGKRTAPYTSGFIKTKAVDKLKVEAILLLLVLFISGASTGSTTAGSHTDQDRSTGVTVESDTSSTVETTSTDPPVPDYCSTMCGTSATTTTDGSSTDQANTSPTIDATSKDTPTADYCNTHCSSSSSTEASSSSTEENTDSNSARTTPAANLTSTENSFSLSSTPTTTTDVSETITPDKNDSATGLVSTMAQSIANDTTTGPANETIFQSTTTVQAVSVTTMATTIPTTTPPPQTGKYPSTTDPNWEYVPNYNMNFTLRCNGSYDDVSNRSSELYSEYKNAAERLVKDAFGKYNPNHKALESDINVTVYNISNGSVIIHFTVTLRASIVLGFQKELVEYILKDVVPYLKVNPLKVMGENLTVDGDYLFNAMTTDLIIQVHNLYSNPCSEDVCDKCYACNNQNNSLICSATCKCKPNYHGADCDIHDNLIIGLTVGLGGAALLFVTVVVIVVVVRRRRSKGSSDSSSNSLNSFVSPSRHYESTVVDDGSRHGQANKGYETITAEASVVEQPLTKNSESIAAAKEVELMPYEDCNPSTQNTFVPQLKNVDTSVDYVIPRPSFHQAPAATTRLSMNSSDFF